MIGHGNRLAAGMRLRHLSLAALLRHTFAAITLRRCHRVGLPGAGHNRSRKQQKRQQRDTDFANRLHGLELSTETALFRRKTRRIVTPIVSR